MSASLPNYLSKNNTSLVNLQLYADRRIEKTETMARTEQEMAPGQSKIAMYRTAAIALAILGVGTLFASVIGGIVLLGVAAVALCEWQSYAAKYQTQTETLKTEMKNIEDIQNSIGLYLTELRKAKEAGMIQKAFSYEATPSNGQKLTNVQILSMPFYYPSIVNRAEEDYDKEANKEFKDAKKYAEMLFEKKLNMIPSLKLDADHFLVGIRKGTYLEITGYDVAKKSISYRTWQRPTPEELARQEKARIALLPV